jgi:bifunctional UDP-N-acetylglucosamine pyrophosphorylase / glucosamine-1-phosphate N-acetyltransferase
MELHVVILAAGKGSRMKSAFPKVLHPLAGKPMLQRVLDTAKELNPKGIHVVIGHEAEQVKAAFQHEDITWVEQLEQLGTGHAVAQAAPNIPNSATVLILYGDVPLIRSMSLSRLIDLVDDVTLGLLTIELDDPSGYGRIIRNAADEVVAIIEQKDANPEQLAVTEVNTGIMCAMGSNLNRWLPLLSNSNAQGEYYLTDLVALAVQEGKEVEAEQPDSIEEVQGVNDRLQLCELECWFQSQQAEQLLLSGVSLYDPNRIDIRGTLTAGVDVRIDLNCIFEGEVVLGDGVQIGPNCLIINSQIGPGTIVKANSIIEDSRVGMDAVVGPFARLRPETVLGDNTKIGNFVETKKCELGKGSKVNHLSYIGDATIGKESNIGAGTITCNYDGVNKSKTEIGDQVFIGSNSSLVAPVIIGDNATVGAGSVITKTIDPDQLAVGRARQTNISGWKKPTKK